MTEPAGRIITFYSYKGGTGRSMALANFAWIMAASGDRVLVIDWDLEAPGLHRYFRPFLVDPDLFETDGLIDTFWTFAASAMANSQSGGESTAKVKSAEVVEGLDDAIRRLKWDFPPGGHIDFIGAGRQGGTYSERVNSFDWKRFYELGGASVLSEAKDHLRSRYNWVLIDSRTGVSDTSGICTIQMPEAIVACFTLNRQSIDGVAAILRSIRAFRSSSVDGSAIEFFPVATRIENAEQKRLEIARGYARTTLAEYLPKTMQSRPREYWDKMEISYRPAYAFEEVLAAFGDATGAMGAADTMLAQTEIMAHQIAGDNTLRMPEIVEQDRERVLEKYAFGTLATPVKDDKADTVFLRNIRAKEQLWRTSKYNWRLLMSRRELDLLTEEDKKGFGRNMAFYLTQSERMQQLLRSSQRAPLAGGILTVIFTLVANITYQFIDDLRLMMSVIIISLILSVLITSLLGAGAQERPYGVSFGQLFLLYLMGPFRPKIRDYDPAASPKV